MYRVAAFPSFPPTGVDPVRPAKVDMESFRVRISAQSQDARRGAAWGPLGMRTEYARPLLYNEEDSNKFLEVAQSFAQVNIPEEIRAVLRVGGLVAMTKAE